MMCKIQCIRLNIQRVDVIPHVAATIVAMVNVLATIPVDLIIIKAEYHES